MSARELLQAALAARLRGVAGLGVFDAPPARGGEPYGIVEEPTLAQADAAGLSGRAGTIAVTWRDGGERPVRLRRLIGAGETAIETMPRDLAEGWRIGGLRLAKSRLARGRDGAWTGTSEWAVRLYRLNG